MFSDYPAIADHIFTFNIDVISGTPDETPADERVGHTVFQVFKAFLLKLKMSRFMFVTPWTSGI
jgi:hypothetical protein